MPFSDLPERLREVRDRIDAAIGRGGHRQAVTIVAVTKTHGPDAVQAAIDAGLHDVGENRVQEALPKMDAIQARRPLTLEADDLEPALRTAWSVIATGPAEIVTDPAEIQRLKTLPLAPWVSSPKPFFVRLTPEKITGRRIPLHPGGVTTEHIDPRGEPT